jgi:hypothetical protein
LVPEKQRIRRSAPTLYWVGVDEVAEKVNTRDVKDFLENLGLDEETMGMYYTDVESEEELIPKPGPQ